VKGVSKEQLTKEQEEEFIEKWKCAYQQGDRYFSPNLSKSDTGISILIS